jgi:hypothetical protein
VGRRIGRAAGHEVALRKYYIAVSRPQRVKPFPSLSVLRPSTCCVRLIYAPAYKKTVKHLYEGGRLRKRRVYRIPMLNEYETVGC